MHNELLDGNFNLIKGIDDKPWLTSHVTRKDWNFPPKIRTKTKRFPSHRSCSALQRRFQPERERKGIQGERKQKLNHF